MEKVDRLKKWINGLTEEQKNKSLLELVIYAIDCEEVSFWDDTKTPYWSNSGDNIDGSEIGEE